MERNKKIDINAYEQAMRNSGCIRSEADIQQELNWVKAFNNNLK